jgi:hypothetical protein
MPVLRGLILLCSLLIPSINLVAQLKLSADEREFLKEICSYYSQPNSTDNLRRLQKKAPVKFHKFIDQLIVSKDNSKDILKDQYLSRPTTDDLMYWYVVREFHYNNSEPDSLKKPFDYIVDSLSKGDIDKRWLLDNYFYRISNRIAMLYNKLDLSSRNFELDRLGYTDDTERAMFVMFMINTCGQRLQVMAFTGKGDPGSAIKRLPKINGKEYYEFTNFSYTDFDWIGYKKIESYNKRHIGDFYIILLNHLNFILSNDNASDARRLFNNSILSKPEYFKYGPDTALNELYAKWK